VWCRSRRCFNGEAVDLGRRVVPVGFIQEAEVTDGRRSTDDAEPFWWGSAELWTLRS
jgi:hypothetical protein